MEEPTTMRTGEVPSRTLLFVSLHKHHFFFSVQEFRFLEDKKLSAVPMRRKHMHL
jgi:hypothetical protein